MAALSGTSLFNVWFVSISTFRNRPEGDAVSLIANVRYRETGCVVSLGS